MFLHISGIIVNSSERSVSCLVFPRGQIVIVGLRPLEVVPFMKLDFWLYRPQRFMS